MCNSRSTPYNVLHKTSMNASSEQDRQALEQALAAFRAGEPVLIMDDADREDEADLCVPAARITAEQVLFLQRNTTGMLCAACDPHRVAQLALEPMCARNTDAQQTPFTVTVDLHRRQAPALVCRRRTAPQHCAHSPTSTCAPRTFRGPDMCFRWRRATRCCTRDAATLRRASRCAISPACIQCALSRN